MQVTQLIEVHYPNGGFFAPIVIQPEFVRLETYVPLQDEPLDAQEQLEMFVQTPQGELEEAMHEVSKHAETILKATDFTPELLKGKLREDFFNLFRMVTWAKENLTGENVAYR